MGSAVTELNGCTSANTSIITSADRWTNADAAMPERMKPVSFTVLDQRFDVAPRRSA
jgi:hypothetical protein